MFRQWLVSSGPCDVTWRAASNRRNTANTVLHTLSPPIQERKKYNVSPIHPFTVTYKYKVCWQSSREGAKHDSAVKLLLLQYNTYVWLAPKTGSRYRHIAYFWVHSFAVSLYFERWVLYNLAISGTSGSSGFGSVSREQMDKRTFEMVRAGLHCERRMSKQILPLLLILGW